MKKRGGVPMRFFLLAIACILLAIPEIAWTNDTVAFSTLALGNQSGIRVQTRVVVRTQTEWQTLWQKHTAGLPRSLARPAIDFSRETIIGIFAGEVPSPARVAVVKIAQQEKQLVVLYRVGELQPGPPEQNGGTITPFQIVRLPRSALPVVFIPIKNPSTRPGL